MTAFMWIVLGVTYTIFIGIVTAIIVTDTRRYDKGE